MHLDKSEVFTNRFQNTFQEGWTYGASADIHSILSSPEIFTSSRRKAISPLILQSQAQEKKFGF